jgi:hypothetical protein
VVICPLCRFAYDTIACPACTERRTRDYLHARQAPYLEQARAGQIKFCLTSRRNARAHIALFTFPARAFCGLSLHKFSQIRIAYDAMLKFDLCEACTKAVRELLKVESL